MADHILKLKAVIDTSTVNSQLGSIQQKYNNANKNLSQTTGQQGLGNLNKLNQTMSRLTASVQRLERTIQNLNHITHQSATRIPKVQMSQLYNTNAMSSLLLASQLMHEGQQTIAAYRAAAAGLTPNQHSLIQYVKKGIESGNINEYSWAGQMSGKGSIGIFNGTRGTQAQQEIFNKFFNGKNPVPSFSYLYDTKNKQFTEAFKMAYAAATGQSEAYVQQINAKLQAAYQQNMKKADAKDISYNKAIKFAAGSYMFGGLGSELQNSESKPARYAGHVVSAGTDTLMTGAMMTAMGFGGPPGWIAAAAIGVTKLIKNFVDDFTAQTEKTAKAIHNVSNAFKTLNQSSKNFEKYKFEKSLDTMDLNTLGTTRKTARTEYEQAEAKYQEFQASWTTRHKELSAKYSSGEISAEQYEAAMNDLVQKGKIFADALKDSKLKLDKVDAAFETLQNALDQMRKSEKQAALTDKALTDFENQRNVPVTTTELEAKMTDAKFKMTNITGSYGLKAYVKYTNDLKKKLLLTNKDTAEYDKLQNLIKENEEKIADYSKYQSEYISYTSRFDTLKKSLNDRNKAITKEVSEESQIKDSLSNRISIASNKLTVADLLGTKDSYLVAAKDQHKNYLSFLEKARNSVSLEEQQENIASANDEKAKMQFSLEQMSLFSSAAIDKLQDALMKIQAPDLNNVTSLGNQGFNFTNSDDKARLSLQTDYLAKIADTTAQIKEQQKQQLDDAFAVYQ